MIVVHDIKRQTCEDICIDGRTEILLTIVD